jgi:hypothetical protein
MDYMLLIFWNLPDFRNHPGGLVQQVLRTTVYLQRPLSCILVKHNKRSMQIFLHAWQTVAKNSLLLNGDVRQWIIRGEERQERNYRRIFFFRLGNCRLTGDDDQESRP